MSSQKCSVQLDGKEIQIESGRLAKQADGSVLVTCGDDIVLVTVVSSHEESPLDFFPMIVEFQERFYASGRIPGGFFKREGRPSYDAILSARLMDRPLRPCFPEGYRRDTQIVATILSYSGQYPVDVLSALGASAALHLSDIPFEGPVASVQVARVNGEFKVNPQSDLAAQADINLFISGTQKGLLMVEGSALFAKEKDILEALKKGHEAIKPLLKIQDELRKKMGSQEKRKWVAKEQDATLLKEVEKNYGDKILKNLTIPTKTERYTALRNLKKEIKEHYSFEEEEKEKALSSIYDQLKYQISRRLILEKKTRIDGRKLDEVRSIACEVGVLPRTHGSSVFTRGETQVLSSITLGTEDDAQLLDNLSGLDKKRFLLHYNFPPYCVGETGRLGGQSRREIGHGFLAEKALKPIMPSQESFPYTLRLVSEVLESNGSSSMGTVCSGSLALMDAGVPVKTPIAGIAMGLIKEGDQTAILSDILGDEDHLGDMDFKVAGNSEGVTAVQMDIKIDSINFDIIEKALNQAHAGRLHILSCMEKVLSQHRDSLSPHAPRIETMKIHPDKIREVIGSGGKMINSIIKDTGVKIDINDDGIINLASTDKESIMKAKKTINQICEDVEEGKVYNGLVKKLADFGAFVEILPNTTGLLHISEMAHKRTEKVSDVVREGDRVDVKVMEVKNGRIRLSIKAITKK